MEEAHEFPVFAQVVLDCTDVRALAEFYRRLLGFEYRPGDEPQEGDGAGAVDKDWLVLIDSAGARGLAFQQVEHLPEPTWPEGAVPQQLHLDLTVPSLAEFEMQNKRALALGATVLLDRSEDPQEPLRVYADPAGHPFCIFVHSSSLD